MTKKPRIKILPSKYDDFTKYISKNKDMLTEHVVSSIEFAIKKNIPNIELFKFKETDYVVEIDNTTYKENLDFIYKSYLDNENYEYCTRLVGILNQIDDE